MGGLANFGSQVVSRKLSGGQWFSLFNNIFIFLLGTPLCNYFVFLDFHFILPLSISLVIFLAFHLDICLFSMELFLATPIF
jgi:hypothetical protein